MRPGNQVLELGAGIGATAVEPAGGVAEYHATAAGLQQLDCTVADLFDQSFGEGTTSMTINTQVWVTLAALLHKWCEVFTV